MGQDVSCGAAPRNELPVQPDESIAISHISGHCECSFQIIPNRSSGLFETQHSHQIGQYYCPCQYYCLSASPMVRALNRVRNEAEPPRTFMKRCVRSGLAAIARLSRACGSGSFRPADITV